MIESYFQGFYFSRRDTVGKRCVLPQLQSSTIDKNVEREKKSPIVVNVNGIFKNIIPLMLSAVKFRPKIC